MSEPRWLPIELVIEINQIVVAETGEPFLIRDIGLLQSALGKPENYFNYGREEDIVTLASVLLFGIARNHPFGQGNKRTAFLSALRFLELNGYSLEMPNTMYLGDIITKVIENELDEGDFIALIRPNIVILEE